ncbi:MAG: sulfatase [Myxococcota bacterium]
MSQRHASRSLRAARAALVGLAIGGFGCAGQTSPDVLLVVADTLRADRLGCYGYGAETSPELDAFAGGAVLFERALAASTLTAPSHASLMTSRWVGEHAIGIRNGTSRLDGETTLAATLAAAGYDTAAFVGNFVIRGSTGLDAGFARYDDELPDVEPNRPTYRERKADETTDRALAWLAERGAAPIFLFVHFQDPHGPYLAPPPYDERFPELAPKGGEPLAALPVQQGPDGVPDYQVVPGDQRPKAYQRRYAQEVAYFDASFGRLLRSVRARGRPLVVAFTADHAESFGEAGYWFQHGHAATPDLGRVPLLLEAPGLEPGRRDDLVHHVDLMPTLLELAGLTPPGELRGVALGPYLRDERPLPERALFCDVGHDLVVYSGDRFYRRWRPPGRPEARSFAGTFRWSPGVPWRRVGDDPALRREALRYEEERREPVPMDHELTPEEREHLTALGYLEPEESE